MDNSILIFVGFELTAQMADEFTNCKEKDKDYLDNSVYLETVEIDGKKYVGKRIEGAVAIDRIEDMARSVVSLLGRVCSELTFRPNEAIVIAAEDEVVVPPVTESKPADGFDYSGLVD